MKKLFSLGLVALAMMFNVAMAQKGGKNEWAPENRTQTSMEKMKVLGLSDEQAKKAEAVFLEFYTDGQKATKEMKESNPEGLKEKRKELNQKKNKALKELLTPEQFKKYKDEVEPALKPQKKAEGTAE